MKFTKMQGAGNDFIIINNMEEHIPVEKLGGIAKTVCARRMSIGADGLMVVDYPDFGGNYKMRFYNSDGSPGEMCGNGARCIARYGYEKGLAGETQKIETPAGMVTGWRQSQRLYKIRLNDATKLKLDEEVVVDNVKYRYSYIELGNPGLPHIVLEIENLNSTDKNSLKRLGRTLRNYKKFPKGANVNFYEIVGEDQVDELTYERGVEDFTMACGTGTGSTVLALTLQNKVKGENVKVNVPGGQLAVTIDRSGDAIKNIYLTGPTNIVAQGEINDEDLIY